MTTYEHAMLGANVALALGCQRRQGWPLVAAAAVAAALPDWDGLSILLGGAAYAQIHRVWGHNLLVASLTGLCAGAVGYVWRLSLRPQKTIQDSPSLAPPLSYSLKNLLEWLLACLLASLGHLPADMVYSGHPEMRNWPLPIFWPFSQEGWVFPWVAWGDVGASVIFVAEMFALYRWPNRGRSIAWLTLVAVHAYVALCWLSGGIKGE